MQRKKGLLIAPAFPADSFWSYKYVIKYSARKAAFPPLGLVSFAAMMPQDEWDFELIDLNVELPSDGQLNRRIQEATAVFVSAMSIQRESLVELLDGPAKGTDTPWVLGGPMASTYRDTILNPHTEAEKALHDGLDYLAWGEATPWIEPLNRALEERPVHSAETPQLFIPERVLNEPSGSRKYLQDKEIFKPLDNVPPPRWDLIDAQNYRSMMIQTTAGCRFRCNFCDIVQFNGGFARAKDKAAVGKELQAILDTGFRGGVFTVDDNFVSEPEAMENILEGMIEFQRANNYPFHFFTQASIDLGKDNLSHLIPLMRQAGFTHVFLGIENPDPEALKGMNKIQNIKTKPEDTVRLLHQHGIEVSAGFIYGTDVDTRQTADLIVDFVKGNSIFSSMTGKLTPMPHTPLYTELKEQGRLLEGNDDINNVNENLQYEPIMGPKNLHDGFSHILASLFNRKAIYERARGMMERVDTHIFTHRTVGRREGYAAMRFFFKQIVRGQGEYFNFLRHAFQRDRTLLQRTRAEAKSFAKFWEDIAASAKGQIELDASSVKQFAHMLDYAHEALVRFSRDRGLSEVRDYVHGVRESISKGSITLESAQAVYEKAMDYCDARKRMLEFPGVSIIKAFELSIMGSHYRTVAGNVLAHGDAESMHMQI